MIFYGRKERRKYHNKGMVEEKYTQIHSPLTPPLTPPGEFGSTMVYYICSDFHGRPMGKLCPVKKMEELITNSVYLCPQVYLCLPNPKSMVFSDEKVRKGGEVKLTKVRWNAF